jgi:hypothetical protein
MAKKNAGDVKDIQHVQATRPEPWPGIQGRSEDKENDLPTGTRRAEQADVTEAQRRLEKDMPREQEPTRE